MFLPLQDCKLWSIYFEQDGVSRQVIEHDIVDVDSSGIKRPETMPSLELVLIRKFIFSTLKGTKRVIPFLYSTVIFGEFEQNMNLKQNLNKV